MRLRKWWQNFFISGWTSQVHSVKVVVLGFFTSTISVVLHYLSSAGIRHFTRSVCLLPARLLSVLRSGKFSLCLSYRWDLRLNHKTVHELNNTSIWNRKYHTLVKNSSWPGLLFLSQCLNAVLLGFAVYYQFLPNPWVVFIIVIYEGLLGGAAYVNTFFFIREEVREPH